MKLVEILARELEVWPDGITELTQWGAAELHDGSGLGADIVVSELADDWVESYVNRPQWEAERDRISKMKSLIEARDNPPSIEPTYEQKLWDRVAQSTLASMLGAIGGADFFVDDAGSHKAVSSSDFASCAADYADAFMAERAKRIGK